MRLTARAPGKINLCLFLGPTRPDGRHQLVTLFDSVRLTDELVVTVSATGADRVVCAGVEGPNLVGGVLAALRAAGWAAPPLTVTIDKRIPVAAGILYPKFGLLLSPILAAAAMSFSSVSVISNALRLRTTKL